MYMLEEFNMQLCIYYIQDSFIKYCTIKAWLQIKNPSKN